MNTEDTPIPFKLSPLAEGDASRRVVPHPTDGYLTRQAFLTDPAKVSDEESRVAAQRLAKEALTAQTIAEMPEDQFRSDEEKTAAASKIVELMTGEKDFDGRLWNGGKGFKTGAEYLRSVKETLSRGMGAAADPELQAWMRMTDEEKDAKLEADRGFLSYIGEAAGDVAGAAGELVRGVPRLSKDEYESAPEDVREASDWMGSVMWEDMPEKERADYEAKVRDWRGGEWQRLKRRGEYEAQLRRRNALLYLPDMVRSLQGDDARALAGELAQNPSRMPSNWAARLERLSTRDIETLAQIRGMTREHVEGGVFNWLGDVAGGVYNGAHGMFYGAFSIGEKIGAKLWNRFADEGWEYDLNEEITRRHALWSAYAGWSSPVAQLSDEHGSIANFTIGLASAVPFIVSMKAKAVGYLACAGEMMSAADAQAAAAGIDTTNPAYIARNAVAGGLYAYMLKAVSPRFLGASANGAAEEMALRTAFMKGVMSGVAKLDTMKVMSQRTASGALMMAMQQGIAAVNEDLNLGGDAWRDAAQRFTETFVSSIPDMLAFSAHGVLEGHARASGGLKHIFGEKGLANRSRNLREAVENAFAVRTAVTGNERMDELRRDTTIAQIGELRRAFTDAGEKGLARLGLKPEEIAEAKDFFEAERRELGAARRLEELQKAEGVEWTPGEEPVDVEAAARRYDEASGDYARAVARLAKTVRGRMRDEKGAVRDLEAVRNVWAEGSAVGAGRGDGADAGAAALVKAGFAPEDAAALSRTFGAERRRMYSPAAAEALRDLYTRSTRGRVEATAALARAFGGRVRTVEGRTYIDLPMPDGGTGTLAVETVDLSRRFYGEAGSAPELARQVERATGGAVKADDWIKMTDAERREIVEDPKNPLSVEGEFEVIDPNDPSLYIVASDAEKAVATVRIDPSADPGAAFHEAMHGFLRFCQETGFWNEADVKWLQDTYGAGRGTKNTVVSKESDGRTYTTRLPEQLNEEAAAEGFRQYLAKRMAGSFVADEPSAFRKLFGLIGRLRHLREARAATERLAANAEEALYDAFLAGRYRHVRDLKFAAPEAPKAETGGASAAPQTGAAPKAGESPAETQSAAVPSQPSQQSQPSQPAAPIAPHVVRFEAQTPKGNKYVGGYYKVFRLADLVHSNDPRYKAHAELQGRNRTDNKREADERLNIKKEFNGRRYLDNAVTSDGAPIVAMLPDAEGVVRPFVLSGNGRVLVLNDLAESRLYDRYRNPLKEWAAEKGVEMDVADADNPVLVRVVDDFRGSGPLEISRLSNIRTSTPPTETELARTDAEHLRSLDLAQLYRANADGSPDMTPGANDEFFRRFAEAPDGESIFDEDRNVGEDSRHRVMRAFLHLAVGDSPRGLAAAQKLVTMSGTYGIDRQKGALQCMAPGVAMVEGNPDYAIGPDVARAIADFMDFTEMKRAGKVGRLEDYIAQGDLLDQPSAIATDILRTLAEGRGAPRDMAERVNAYAEVAKLSDADGSLGGTANARSREDVWRAAGRLAEQRIAERTPQTRFSIRSEADGKKDEGKKGVVARVQPSEQGQNRPAHLRNDTTQHTLTLESAAPVRGFGDSISQDGVKSPADFLTGLVHALGSTETNPDKTQYFDITHEDGRNLSLRVANHRATARQYTDHGNTAEVKTSVVVKMSDKPFLASDGVELTEHVYFSDKLTAEREAGIAHAVAEWIATGEWNGPAADQVNMSPRRRYSIAGIYTGTAADYANRSRQGGVDDGPSLKKIGTGEGSQVYGWGLYGSNVRGVAESYAVNGIRDPRVMAKNFLAANKTAEAAIKALKEGLKINKSVSEEVKKTARKAIKILQSGESIPETIGNLYEQTFFTDRAPGDESHLLKWYEPVGKETWDVIRETERNNGTLFNDRGQMLGLDQGYVLEQDGKPVYPANVTGATLYNDLAIRLGSPQAASEFLARAGIDGVKYPVDSFGGKGVKDGDKAGWNYVSFRDDNIRVDHKWTDGAARYSIRSFSDGTPFVEVDNVPDEIRNETDPDELRSKVEDLIRSRWMNKIIDPQGVRAFVNGRTAHEYVKPAKPLTEEELRAKMNAAGNLDEVVATSGNARAVPDGQSGHVHENVKGWEHRDAIFRVDGRFWAGKVNIAILDKVAGKVGDFRKLHDLTGLKEITDEVWRLHGNPVEDGQSYPSNIGDNAGNIPKPSDEIKADPEAFARRSVVARATEGDVEERESALVAFVAERALRHGPRPKLGATIGRIGLELGLETVDASRIRAKGEALAERVRGTVIEKAIQNGDVATATAMLAREADIDRLVAEAAKYGGQFVRAGEGKIKSLLEREIEKHIRSFNAASLSDMERDTGIDIADEILHNSPEKFDPSASAKATADKKGAETEGGDEGSAPGDSSPGDGNLTDYEIARRQRVRKEAEERVARMIATAKERVEAAKKEREEREARREERRRKAEEAAAAAGEGAVSGDGSGDEGSAPGDASPGPSESPRLSTWADFKTPEEFAAFFRVWAEERYKKEHGASTLGKHEEKRLFPEFYRKAVVRELQDLADKLLPPKGARATVNRWLGEIQPGVRPDTLERVSADVFAYINKNAIRESRTAQIQKFRNGLKPFVKGTEFDDLKLDADRRVTGWVEEAARYIRRVCNLSIRSINGEPSQLDAERARLQAILDRREKVYDDEGKVAADAPKFDMETRRALAKLQLLEKYGAMKRYMPGQIADLADEAMRWLQDEAGKLEAAWKDARDAEESIRGALVGGIVGPNGQKYKAADGVAGWADKLFDSMNGMIRLRLQHLVRFADSKSQQKAKDAINRLLVMLGDGEVEFTRHLQDDKAAFHQALVTIFTDRATGRFDRRACADWLNRMTEEIPQDLSRRLSKQGYGDSMTYGQMLQLLVSLEQKSYAEAIKANGRDGQADLIRSFETVGPDGRRERVLTDKDIMFIDWLRSFYEAKRGMLSEVTKRMTGLPIDSPDPLYCPVKMYMGDQARGMHVDSSAVWDPIGAVFSRRVETLRDFDESASILGQFSDRSAEAAKLAAWGERGSIIRGVFTNAGVQESIRRAFGGGELTKILKQLEETFNGGENIKKSPGEIAAADKAMNWMTYLSLGYNPLSAAKQTTSFPVWANVLPGGFKDLWRYMTDVDRATIRHLKESDEYKVRYGTDTGSGQDVATKAVNMEDNPAENPVTAFFRKTSMGLLRKGDFLPGGWIAQGVFRDFYNRHLKEGMEAQAADRLAMTETFNLLEETQQSGRTYNTPALVREHGRLGRLLVQFATSPLQQLQFETQALREVLDLKRYRPKTPDADFEKRYTEAKGKLIRAVVINHVMLPAMLHAVTSLYRLAMGYDPEWEQEGWHWSLLRDICIGQASRVTFLGTLGTTLWDAAFTGKVSFSQTDLLPIEGLVRTTGQMGKTARDVVVETWRGIRARDFEQGFDYEKVQKDLHRMLRSTSITRTPYDVLRLATGKAYAEREERREKRRQKEAKK